MPILKIDNLSEYGIIRDLRPVQLPINAFSAGYNVHVVDGKLSKFYGESEYFDTGDNWDNGTAEIVYYALPIESAGTYYWIYCGLKDVKIYDGSTATEITRVAGVYSATADLNWTGGVLNGIAILNNGVDDPQFISDYASPGNLADLTNWPASTTCKAMRVYKNYLIAMDVTKSGVRYPNMIKWSDSAGLGAVPGSWDETDATTDAGEVDLAENRTEVNIGAVLDCMVLRDANIVYTDSSTWSMQYIGGSAIFQFRELFQTSGALSRRCMAEFNGNHFVVTNGDVIVHNGVSSDSVIDKRRKRCLFNGMSGAHYERTYVFANYTNTEMWICYVEEGSVSTLPSKALVWNWKNNTWGERELPNNNAVIASGGYGTPHIEGGIVDTSAVATDIWSLSDGNWDTWTVDWGETSFAPQSQSPLICADKLYKGDDTNTYDGTNFLSYVERTGIPVGEQTEFVTVKRAYPRINGSDDVYIYVGAQDSPEGSVNWQTRTAFTPGTDIKVDTRVTGTHMAYRIESTGDQEWDAMGIDFEFDLNGKRA